MIFLQPNEYGPFSDIVSSAGSLIATAGALALGWRRRARWEPSEEDVANGPQRVGSLLVVIAIALLFTQMRDQSHLPFLNRLTLWLGIATVVSLLIYGILVGTLTYNRLDEVNGNVVQKKIIGGFWLTKAANIVLSQKAAQTPPVFLTKQELLMGAGYDPDKVWSPFSRSLAKSAFVICYLGLTASGTVALACASIILGLGQARP